MSLEVCPCRLLRRLPHRQILQLFSYSNTRILHRLPFLIWFWKSFVMIIFSNGENRSSLLIKGHKGFIVFLGIPKFHSSILWNSYPQFCSDLLCTSIGWSLVHLALQFISIFVSFGVHMVPFISVFGLFLLLLVNLTTLVSTLYF